MFDQQPTNVRGEAEQLRTRGVRVPIRHDHDSVGFAGAGAGQQRRDAELAKTALFIEPILRDGQRFHRRVDRDLLREIKDDYVWGRERLGVFGTPTFVTPIMG